MTLKASRRHMKRVLCALYRLTGETTHAHYPLEAIMRKLPPAMRDTVKRALKQLEAEGLVYRKGGTKSYGLTQEGLEKVREICIEE